MRLELPEKIDRQQWLDRMGVKGNAPAELLEQMDRVEEKLMGTAMPRGIYRFMPVDIITLTGDAIKKHLKGCREVVVMAVTLGALTDNFIRMCQVRDMAEALMADSGASILIEQICDQLEAKIKSETDQYLTGRYSPGYGDYPIHLQTELIWLLDAQKKIGLTVNESYIMIPRKSITAVMGASEHPVTGYRATCEECVLKDACILRKEGKNCG